MSLPNVVDLQSTRAAEIELVGGKAAGLARLVALGLPVPRGLAMTTAAFRGFCRHNGIRPDPGDSQKASRALRAGHWPEALRRDLDRALAQLQGESFAVRSSATCEDGHRFSMAGQFESYLSVSRAEVPDRIAACWASLFEPRARPYMERMPPGAAAMAVVVQELVDPEWSGVAFSLDPVTGTFDEIVVEWTGGVGVDLVGGRTVPERVGIAREATVLPDGVPAPLRGPLLALRDLVVRIERAWQEPVDVEWCARSGGISLLQARPVTTAAGADQVLWSSVNLRENFPAPLAPAAAAYLARFYREYVGSALRLVGWRERDLMAVEHLLGSLTGIHRGRIHYNLTSWHGLISYFPWSARLSSFLDGYLGQDVPVRPPPDVRAPALRRRTRGALGRVRFCARLGVAFARAGPWIAALDRRLARAREEWKLALGAAQDPRQAEAVVEDTMRFLARDWRGPCAADLMVMVIPGVLGTLTERWCHRSGGELLPALLQGVVVKSVEPARLLWELARSVATTEAGRELLLRGDYAAWRAGLTPSQAGRFEEFLDQYGARCYSDCALVSPTFAERPELAFALVREYAGLPDPFSPHASRAAAARERLVDDLSRGLGPVRGCVLRTLARGSVAAVQLREQGRLAQSVLFGEARRAFLRLGELLAAAGAVHEPEDVFELTWDEARALARGTYCHPGSIPSLIVERRRARAADEAQPPPGLFLLRAGQCLTAPSSPQRRRLARAGEALGGVPVAPGKVRARARVLRDPARDTLHRGEVLVASSADPGWTPLILLAGGIVLERGGVLSHGAIVAREAGIPGLVQVKDACCAIADGATVLLDADAGTVVVEAAGA